MDISAVTGTVGAAVGVASFAFAVYQHMKVRHRKEREETKIRGLQLRLRLSYDQLRAVHEGLELLIKRSKDSDTTARELRYLARTIRAPIVATLLGMHSEQERLKSWTFGATEDVPIDEPSPPPALPGGDEDRNRASPG